MPANTLDWFPFYPDDYLSDVAVLSMSAEAEGCYIRLLARSWKSPTPGVVPSGLVFELCSGHRCLEWGLALAGLERAFDTESRPGYWVQKRMVDEYAAAEVRTEARRRGAASTNASRSANANRGAKRSLGGRYARVDVGVDSTESDKAEACEPSTNGIGKAEASESAQGGIEGVVEETPRQWSEGFEQFWQEYPRKVKRVEAEKAYLKLRPRTQETYDALFVGLAHWKAGEWSSRDESKIEHASTWLNNRRYSDAQVVQQQ